MARDFAATTPERFLKQSTEPAVDVAHPVCPERGPNVASGALTELRASARPASSIAGTKMLAVALERAIAVPENDGSRSSSAGRVEDRAAIAPARGANLESAPTTVVDAVASVSTGSTLVSSRVALERAFALAPIGLSIDRESAPKALALPLAPSVGSLRRVATAALVFVIAASRSTAKAISAA
jgi:hypothetical protein